MSVTPSTLLASELQRRYEARFITPLFRNSDEYFLGYFPNRGMAGGDALRIPIAVTESGGAEIYSVGDPIPAAGHLNWVQAVFAWQYFRIPIEIHGHAKDDAVGTDLGPMQLNSEMEAKIATLVDLVQTTFMADSTVGLLGLIDDDTTAFGGLSRSVYTGLQGEVSAVGGALTLAALNNHLRDQRDNEHVGRPGLLMSRGNQINYYKLLLPGTGAGAEHNASVHDTERAFDMGFPNEKVRFAGTPWAEVPDFVNTEIAFLDMRPQNVPYVVKHREFQVRPHDSGRDSDLYEVTFAMALATDHPEKHGKMETLTA